MSSTMDVSVIGSPHASTVMGLVAARFGNVDPSDRAAVESFFATLSSLDPEIQAAVGDEVERLSLASEIDPELYGDAEPAIPEVAPRSEARSLSHSGPMTGNRAHDAVSATMDRPGSREVDFALVVGIEHYPRFRSVEGALADATRVHTWLCEPDGGGVAAQHSRLLLSGSDQAVLSQEQVDEELLELVTEADAIGGGRRLYMYFSGHGAASPAASGHDVALLLPNWSSRLARLALSADAYRSALSGMGLFEEVVMMLDCSRTAEAQVLGLPPTITYRPQTQPRDTRTFVAYAGEAGTPAFERRGQHHWQGVFTSRLLSILRESTHGISASELTQALEHEVASTGQRLHVVNGLHKDSVIGHQKLVITFVHARGRVRLWNGHRTMVAERDVTSEPWELSLEEGLYKLEDVTGRSTLFDHAGEAVTRVAL